MGTLDYYTALMRVAPGAVARSAVRRVQGVARQALYRRRDRFDEEHLRVAFGATTAEELVGALPRLDMALDETLRMYPPAWIGPRRSVEPFEELAPAVG